MRKNSNIIRWAAAGFFVMACLVLPADCFAGMAVSPMQQWVEVKPGKDASFSVTITNIDRGFGTPPCTVNVEVLDFTVSTQGGISFDKIAGHSRSAAGWISFDTNKFVLEPGESKNMKGKVSAPSNADGDYWAALMVSLDNPKKQAKGININLRTASGIFVHVDQRKNVERASVTDINVILPEFVPNKILAAKSDEEREAAQQEQTLRINAELKNDGLATFLAKGQALLYGENWRQVASIPLYTRRTQILPGHSRCFTGVMAQPLPAGKYKVRVIFETESNYGRKITKDTEFSVSQKLASQWAGNFTFDNIQALNIEPQELKLTLTGGRFTVANFLIANQCSSTVSMRCRLETKELPEGWLELESTDFILNPNTRRNMACQVRIPPDAKQGQYNGIILIEVEHSGLTVQDQNNVELHKIPICIVITK
jgi:hypothetical protein